MYASVGYGSLTASQIVNKLYTSFKQDDKEEQKKLKIKPNDDKEKPASVLVKGADGILVRFANCCRPIPGDSIIGFVSKSKGVTIHRMDCPNVLNMSRDRLVEVSWGNDKNKKFIARIIIECKNHEGVLLGITRKLFDLKLNINSINTSMKNMLDAMINLEITLTDPEMLEKVIKELKSLPDIYDVYRK